MALRSGSNYNNSISSSPVSSLEKAPKTEEEMVGFVEEVWGYNRTSRSGFEYSVKEALHFIGGDQWVQYLSYENRFTSNSLADWVPTPVTNIIGRTFDRLMDILLEGDPFPTVHSATSDQEDLEAAISAKRTLESEARRLKTQVNCYAPAAAWLISSGSMAVSSAWNGKSGDQVRMPKYGLKKTSIEEERGVCQSCGANFGADELIERCPICGGVVELRKVQTIDGLGRPQFDTEKVQKRDKEGNSIFDSVSLGNIEERAVNMLNFYPQRASSWDHVRHVVEVEAMDIEEIKDTWGKKASDVVAESLDVDSWDSVVTPTNSGYADSNAGKDRDQAIVKWMRHEPNRIWPNGILFITSNGNLLHKGDLDSLDGKLPYRFERWRAIPNTFWGMSPLRDLIPLQKRLNAIDSHLILNRKKMAANQWLIPQGSGVRGIDGRPGLEIPYDPMSSGGHKPELVPGVPVPPQVLQEREQVMRDYQEISGEMEVLLGRIPPGVESGYHTDLLVEQALKRFGPIFKRFRVALSEHEQRKLQLIQKHWTEARLVKVLGENQDTEAFHYKGSDMRDASDMIVTITSELEASPALRRSRVEKALETGLLGDARRPEVRGKILEKLGIEGFDVDYVSDAKKARRVIHAAKNGLEMPPVFPGIDNPAIQLTIFREFILSAEFEKEDEEVQQAVFQRAQELIQAQQEEQQKVQAAAMAAKGTGDQVSDAVAQSGALGDSAAQQQVVQ